MRFKMSGIEFGKTKEGNTVTKYLLKNKNGMEVAVMDRSPRMPRLRSMRCSHDALANLDCSLLQFCDSH